jgi:diacylglycerol kinase family enzyme
MVHPPRLEVDLGSETVTGVTAIIQNAEPYTYFGNRPVQMGEGAQLDSRDLAGLVLKRATPLEIPTITWRALSKRAHLIHHRQVHGFAGMTRLRVRSADKRPLPLQVDGDYIGEVPEADFSVHPAGMLVVA